MTESAGVELAQGQVGYGKAGSSLYFNETSYLPHEIDWSYINQEWSSSVPKSKHLNGDHWASSCSPAFSWANTVKNGQRPSVVSASKFKGSLGSFDANADTSLFSSSLPSVLRNKLTLSETKLCIANEGVEEGIFGSLEDMESQTIGNLLPDDEEELLAGVGEEYDRLMPTMEDYEDFDLFSSGGGLELEGDSEIYQSSPLSQPASGVGEHPFGEHPSRTLFVRNINSNVEDSELRTLFEQYGDIRTLYTACKHRGFVMISYYDIRSARVAMRALQGKPLRRRKLDIHFSIPKDNPSDKDVNQGTLVVFNLDTSVSNEDLRQIFGYYGEIKEIRETPHKRHHKFIEFYDVRAAEAALRALNRSDIAGKRIKLEPSRPGGARRSLMQQLSQEVDVEDNISNSNYQWTNSPPAGGLSTEWSDSFEGGDATVTSAASAAGYMSPFSPKINISSPEIHFNNNHNNINNNNNSSSSSNNNNNTNNKPLRMLEHQHSLHPHSLPEYNTNNSLIHTIHHFNNALTTNAATSPLRATTEASSLHRSSSLSASLTSQPFIWGGGGGGGSGGGGGGGGSGAMPYNHSKASTDIWQSLPYSNNSREHLLGSPFSPRSHHFGSFSRESSSVDRQQSYLAESPPYMHQSSRMMNVGSLDHHHHHHHQQQHHSHHQGPSSPNFGMFLPQRMFSNGSPLDDRRTRSSSNIINNSNSAAQAESKKQFQLDLDHIISGEDVRTTLMIKNIPNKYTSKMLLAAIDEQHRGTYDFIYLPIDFKNKCNVGYAFINMLSPTLIIPFYQTFNGKKWEKFNSEKVASLAYARIQGKSALIAHFQNSSLMNEDKRCRPIIFHSDGPNAGDQMML